MKINETVKKIAIFIFTGTLLVVVFMMVHNMRNVDQIKTIGTFDISDYQTEITAHGYKRNMGEVPNAETAINCAKELWVERWGEYGLPDEGEEIKVFYDESERCWLIVTDRTLWAKRFRKNYTGVNPYALIHMDGEVLAVWMA